MIRQLATVKRAGIGFMADVRFQIGGIYEINQY